MKSSHKILSLALTSLLLSACMGQGSHHPKLDSNSNIQSVSSHSAKKEEKQNQEVFFQGLHSQVLDSDDPLSFERKTLLLTINANGESNDINTINLNGRTFKLNLQNFGILSKDLPSVNSFVYEQNQSGEGNIAYFYDPTLKHSRYGLIMSIFNQDKMIDNNLFAQSFSGGILTDAVKTHHMKGSAIYKGKSVVLNNQTLGLITSAQSNLREETLAHIVGASEVVVDFDKKTAKTTISNGAFDAAHYENPKDADKSKSVVFEGKIFGNGFEGKDTMGEGTLKGHFYGPNAEEVAGTFFHQAKRDATKEGQEYKKTYIGAFGANKQ